MGFTRASKKRIFGQEFIFLGAKRLFLIVLISLWGCSSGPLLPKISHEEAIRQAQVVGNELSEFFEEKLKLKTDLEVTNYLGRVSKVLKAQTPDLKNFDLELHFFYAQHKKWATYSLPGAQIYLPIELIRSLEFENELAALIALELSHLSRKHLYLQFYRMNHADKRFSDLNSDKHLEIPQSNELEAFVAVQKPGFFRNADFFGDRGIFNYPDQFLIESIRDAVGILYRSGYDARGLISVLMRFVSQAQQSPYSSPTLSELLDFGRREIALNSPLRNPVVQSHEFLRIRKRIKNL